MPTTTVAGLGLDPGLRHGSLTYARFIFELDPATKKLSSQLVDYKPLFDWNAKSPHSLSEDSTVQDTNNLSDRLIQAAYPHAREGYIAIDYDPYSVFWRSRKMQAVKLGFFMGNLARAMGEINLPVFFYSPAEVREKLGLPKKADKTQTWNFLSGLVQNCLGNAFASQVTLGKEGDRLDSFLLSYLIARAEALARFNEEGD